MDEELKQLFSQRLLITQKITSLMKQKYSKYQNQMSSEVKSDNPYSRLMALKSMGVVNNYEQIKQFTVVIIGVGGVGSVVAEMLTRCGIGKLIIYDYDTVELANMNRLFFTPQQVGLTKVVAAQETLQFINPEVEIEPYDVNVTTMDGYDHMKERLLNGSLKGGKVDLVLSCVDNYSARMSINLICTTLDQNWIESGVSEDAMSSHIQIMIPGETACFGCATPLAVAEGTEKTLKREGYCAASLPTTMGVTAAFMAQNVLKLLLGFGELAYCLQYNAKVDFFSNYVIKPDPACKIQCCQEMQLVKKQVWEIFIQTQRKFLIEREILKQQENQIQNKQVTHEDNEWEIEIVDDIEQPKTEQIEVKNQDEDLSLEQLMNKLGSI